MGKKRSILVDDRAVIRQGTEALLTTNPEYEVAGEAEDALEAIWSCRKLRPTIVFLDVRMHKGSQAYGGNRA